MIALEVVVLALVFQGLGVLRSGMHEAPAVELMFEGFLILTLVTAWLLMREARHRQRTAKRGRLDVPTMRALVSPRMREESRGSSGTSDCQSECRRR